MVNALDNFLNSIWQWLPKSTYSYDYTGAANAPAQAQVSSNPQQTASPSPIANAQQITQQAASPSADLIKQNLMKLYGADSPALKILPDLLQAGQQTPDPYMPLVMAMRETQGGRDLADPAKNANLGANDIFNIRNAKDANGNYIGQPGNNKPFINYPDVHTAIFGGQNGPVTSGGFTGLVNGPIYQDYQKSKNLQDFFAHYSPPADKNGDLQTQVDNYNWIRSHLLGQ
jgi:hypothetical protein